MLPDALSAHTRRRHDAAQQPDPDPTGQEQQEEPAGMREGVMVEEREVGRDAED